MTSRSYTIFRHIETLPQEETGPYRVGSGLAAETDIREGAQNLDHSQDAIDHLIPDYDNVPRLEAFLRAAGAQLTQAEGQALALHRQKALAYAEGIYLDNLGDIVGEPRQGRDDDTYRLYIGIRILVNNSEGDWDSLYAILTTAFPTLPVAIFDYDKAIDVYVLDDIDPVDPQEFVKYLEAAKPAGKSLKLGYTYAPAADTLFVSGINFTGDAVVGGVNVTGGLIGGITGI